MVGVTDIASPDPRYIPGYGGHCPQYTYRCGDTYGNTTHKLLVDPAVNTSEYLVVSDRSLDDYQVYRPPETDKDIVNVRFKYTEAIYKHPTIPGYEGFIPRMNAALGQRYTVAATEALADFERGQLRDRQARHLLHRISRLQDGAYCPKNLEDTELVQSQFRLPLLAVRPEMAGVVRTIPVPEASVNPPTYNTSPYFSDPSDPEKYLKRGFAGHVPFGYAKFGETHKPYTNSALCDFTSNYRHRQSTEWAPVTITNADPPLRQDPNVIYPPHTGLLPNYAGHVPGTRFRPGKTFGADTRDAKRWLRGDFTL